MWFLGSVLLFLLFGSAGSMTPGIQNIMKKPGDDVTLMCEDPEYENITALEWRREDSFISEYLFVFRDGRPLPSEQHESYRNRVFLNDSQMKDGDLSVVLENVTINDTGTYQCRVRHKNGDPLKTISTIHLSVVPPGQRITARPGDDVTLTCQDTNEIKCDVCLWSRLDLKMGYVFLYRYGYVVDAFQHGSFRNRVFLKDSQMKDGNLSVVLKNVMMNDTGTYQCATSRWIRNKRSILPTPLICIIHLSVDPSPGDPSPGNKGGLSPGVLIRIVLAVLLVVVPAVVLWIYRKKKGPNQSSSGSNNQQEFELDRLNSDS